MHKKLFLVLLCFTQFSFAQSYDWESATKDWEKKVKIGGRIQTILAHDNENNTQDFYLRRTRLNIDYQPWKKHKFVYDIRNDGANEKDKGEQKFVIGDAFWNIDINKYTVNNVRFFRAKVDVSYSQTSSSKNLFTPLRAEVAERASDFVVHNRRAANAQANGNMGKLAYQVVLSDGVDSRDMDAIEGEDIAEVTGQALTYGAKLRYFFMGDAKENNSQDTFYGEHNTFSLGFGYFANDRIFVSNTNNVGALQDFSFARQLTNVELSFSYKNFRFLSEYFSLKGDLIDTTATNKDDILGNSDGYYWQFEYLFGKWAPYFIYENFNKAESLDDAVQIVSTLGLNYYHKLEAMRFGVAYRKTENGTSIGDDRQHSTYGYFMLHF